MSDDTMTDILTKAEHQMLRSEVEKLLLKNQQLRASLEQERQQYREMVAKHGKWRALYTELKTHIQDVMNDNTDLFDEFDEEKLAKHGIVKPPTLYSCEYEVKYTGWITIKADSEEAARNKADEIMSEAVYCQLSEINDDEVSDQNHNDFDLEINDCEEQ
jgi:hypothetical protein